MEFIFYTCSLIAVITTLKVVTNTNPMRALLYLIISLLSISGIFFSLGSYFAGALEVIVYTSAIMVMFVFVIMILNLSESKTEKRRQWLKSSAWISQIISSTFILFIIIYDVISIYDQDQNINVTPMPLKAVGMDLFGPYILVVELTSILLLVSLVVAFHISRTKHIDKNIDYRVSDLMDKNIKEYI